MKSRLSILFVFIVGFIIFSVLSVAAQDPRVVPADEIKKASWQNTYGNITNTSVNIGEPGLSFRYSASYGTSGRPYIEDSSHLNMPYGIGLDSNDNLWVGEWSGARALKYNSSGVYQMSIGEAGIKDTDNDRNLLQSVADVAVDSSGNVWIADPETHRVVKYNSSGEFQSQLGATWEDGSDNSHFDNPRGIGLDGDDNIYVSDNNNHRIQIFDAGGTYTATIGITGESGSDNNHLYHPRHFTIDSNNLLYVADMVNHRVQIFDVSNLQAISYVATIGVTGESGADNSHFNYPMGVAVDNDYIYVADSENYRVQIFDRSTRAFHTSIIMTSSGNNSFWADVAVDSEGNVYVVDANMRVLVFNNSFNYVRSVGTASVPYLTDANHFNAPHRIAATGDGGMLVVEYEGHRLIKLDKNGNQLWAVGEAGIYGTDTAHLRKPLGVAVAANEDIYVADAGNNRVQVFDADGNYKDTFGDYGTGNDELNWPAAIAFAPNGNIYVVDTNNYRVQIFNSSHTYWGTIGVTGESGSDNSHFGYPLGVAVDSNGNIYVADEGNNRVQVFNNNHVYVRTVGVTGICGDSFDHFCGPHDVTVDAQNRLYVADTWNNRVQVFGDTGAYLTTIGDWGDRTGELIAPKSVAVAANGTVYIADYGNYRIQKYALGVPGWEQVNINGFGEPSNSGVSTLEIFNGQMYAGASNWNTGGQIWRTDDASTWTTVGNNGSGSLYLNDNAAFGDMIVFNGQLYAGVGWGGGAARIWRSANGADWTPVESDGFGDTDNEMLAPFTVFNNQLYVSAQNRTDGLEIWRSSTGDTGSWSRVVTGGNGNANNFGATGFIEFNGYLYAGVENENDGAEVWRTNDGATWSQVNANGFGDADNTQTGGLATQDGYLYVGTRDDTTGAQLWRSNDGVTWNQIIGNGFGDVSNYKIETVKEFNGNLYVITLNDTTGTEVWRSSDGQNWTQVNPDGFGDSNNTGTLWNSATVKFNSNLYIGTWNWGNGGEIWRMSNDSTVISPNEASTATFTDTHGLATTLQIPADAVTQSTNLVYTAETSPTQSTPSNLKFAGRAFNLDAYQDGMLVEDMVFSKSVTITLHYADIDVSGLDENILKLEYWTGTTWRDAACGAYDRHPNDNWLVVPICHLSEFALFEAGEQSTIYLPLVLKQ